MHNSKAVWGLLVFTIILVLSVGTVAQIQTGGFLASSGSSFDFSPATLTKIAVGAGSTATVNGAIKYDSTADMMHGAQASGDAFIPQFTVIPANNDCATWVVSGSKYKLGTFGSGCGGSQVYRMGATFGFPLNGVVLTTSQVNYSAPPASAACTIQNWSIYVDQGTATVQFIKVASGTALPTIGANSISTSGVSISSGTVVDRNTTLTDFTTTSVSIGDVIGVFIKTLGGTTPDYLAAAVECK